MTTRQARSLYRQTASHAQIHPVKLIHLMYERVLVHLEKAAEGIAEKSPRKRGEHVGKVIALVTELGASIQQEDQSEAAQFLRGLYHSIITELPKVSLHNDPQILTRTSSYIIKLKEIWEQTAMRENGLLGQEESRSREERLKSRVETEPELKQRSQPGLSFSI